MFGLYAYIIYRDYGERLYMKKRVLGLVGAALVVSTLITGAVFAAAEHIKIIVNGQELKFAVQPLIADDKVIAPVRVIAESLGANVMWNEQDSSVTITTKDKMSKAVAAVPDSGITLSAVEEDGMYKDFTLEVKESKRFFDWKNVSNPSYAPKLLLSDVNHDGKQELAVILTTGTGTGVHVTEAHVLNPDTLAEIYIDNPKAIILKNVKTSITDSQVEVTVDGQKTVIDKADLDIEPAHLFSDIGFDSICKFDVVNDELTANIGAQISPAGFIGYVQITYVLKDNMYQAGEIEFTGL